MKARAPTAEPIVLMADALRRRREELCALLADAVHSGASVGYLETVDPASLDSYWRGIADEVDAGLRSVFVVLVDDRVVGSVQLALSPKQNQPHRADVQKLLVHREYRRRGLGAALMACLETVAIEQGRWLLTLDTRTGSDADRLYRAWGWQPLGAVPDYALDPDGTPAACTFYWKRLQ